ncbi:MAG: AAA family ATPase [Anaerolineae bacterium]|nr:AAA family ATPase [Anaerolineae bacterium]
MLDFDVISFIPESLKTRLYDGLVDTVADVAQKVAGQKTAHQVQKLRSDAVFQQAFEAGLKRAIERFIAEYELEDEDVVAAITQDQDIFKHQAVQDALLTILKKLGAYLAEEREAIERAWAFPMILANRKNRERVDRAITYPLKCLVEELWHLPELQGVYMLQFQRLTAEAAREQVTLQKAQLQLLSGLDSGLRETLGQLTEAIAQQKLLPGSNPPALPPPPQRYHNLPHPDYEQFVGRKTVLQEIRKLLNPKHRAWVITIDGIGGIGKTTLALEVAQRYLRHADQLPVEERFEAIIWTTAKQTVLTAEGIAQRPQAMRTLDDIYTAIAITLEREDIIRARVEEQDDLIRRALAQQRTLLIIDNLETVDDERVMTFIREVPAPTKAIVTTRHRLDVAYSIRLSAMESHEARELIANETRRRKISLSENEIDRLFQRTGGIPLAIVWSIAQMGFGYGIEAVLARLGQPNSDIARFCFEGSVDLIRNQPAHKLLMVLPLFTPDASREALGYVADLPILDRDDGLVSLEKLSLINRHAGRFTLLPLTKTFASAELDCYPEFREQASRRWIDYLREISKGPEGEYYWRYRDYKFHEEGPNLLEAVEWVYQHGTSEDVFELTLAADNYLDWIGDWNRAIAIKQRALDLATTIQAQIFRARFSSSIGWYHIQQGNYHTAKKLFTEARVLYQEVGNQEGECIALMRLGAAHRKEGNYNEAKQCYDQAWPLAETLGSGDLQAVANFEYGKLARDQQQWELAWEHLSKMTSWFEARTELAPADEEMARSTWGHLAIVAYHQGRFQEAKELCLKSLEFFKDQGTKSYMATLNYRLALAEAALGEREPALEHARFALDWFKRLGMQPDIVEVENFIKDLSLHSNWQS